MMIGFGNWHCERTGVTDRVAIWRSAVLDGIPHGFAGRRGGVSRGAFSSLNAGPGSGEAPVIISENRARVANAILPGAALAGVYQVHGRECVTVDTAYDVAARPAADAIVADRPGVLLSVLTADCAPVLLADPAAGVVGAAHAGWKGALAGVTDSTVSAMQALGANPGRIVAAIGPCIAQTSYEVDRQLLDAFVSDDPQNERFFKDGRTDRWQFDLAGYVGWRLALAGIRTVDILDTDTYARDADFYSFRRATHRGEPGYGRQISMIAAG